MLEHFSLGKLLPFRPLSISVYKLNGLLALWFLLAYNLPFLKDVWIAIGDKNCISITVFLAVLISLLLLNCLLILCINIKSIYKPSLTLLFLISSILLYSNSTGKQYNPFAFEFSQWFGGTGRFLTFGFAFTFFFLFLLPATVLWKLDIRWASTKSHILKTVGATLLVCSLIVTIYQLTEHRIRPFYQATRSALVNVIPAHFIDSSAKYIHHQYFEPVHTFSILDNAPSFIDTKQNTTVVLVVGESIRADVFNAKNLLSLEQHEGQKISLAACDTYSESSTQCIFSFLPLAGFNDQLASHQQNVLDLLALSGVNIYWLSNHRNCGDLCARANVYERHLQCENKPCFDHELIDDLLDDIISNTIDPDAPNLIIIQTQNISSPLYSQFYPREYATNLPECNTVLVTNCDNSELLNSYQNAMHYIEFVLSRANSRLNEFHSQHPNNKTSLIFTAKFGESLGEKGFYFHGAPKSVAPKEQLQVPLFIVDDNLPIDCLSKLGGKLSHDVLSHTLLGYFHIRTKVYSAQYDIGSLCEQQTIKNSMPIASHRQ